MFDSNNSYLPRSDRVHTAEVAGSIPASPTNRIRKFRSTWNEKGQGADERSGQDSGKGVVYACLASLIFWAVVVGVLLFARGVPALDLNLSGFSYHTDRNADMEGFNPGVGLRQDFHDSARGTGFIEAGIYRDSLAAWAKYGGAGYQFKLGKTLRAGALLAVIDSRSYNEGRTFVAPVPMVSLYFKRFKIHSIYIPSSVAEKGGDVFGFYVGIPIL